MTEDDHLPRARFNAVGVFFCRHPDAQWSDLSEAQKNYFRGFCKPMPRIPAVPLPELPAVPSTELPAGQIAVDSFRLRWVLTALLGVIALLGGGLIAVLTSKP